MKHPLHPALVHFPVACWSLATLGDLASLRLGEPAWRFAGVSLVIGTLAALPAMLAGLLDFTTIEPGSAALRDANRHMLLAMTAWCLYAASLMLHLDAMALVQPGAGAIGLGVLGFIALAAAGWHGGKLVHIHGVGHRD